MSDGQSEHEFGPWLARQLRRAGLTQAELAERLDLTRAAVSAWITGRAQPREETKRAIAEVFGADPAAVYNRTGDLTPTLPRQWYHRPAHADGGREYGNAAAFAFDADLSVLAKEATQNSLDERFDRKHAVRVRYIVHELTGERLDAFLQSIQWDQLQPHYEQAAGTSQKVSKSLRSALEDLASTKTLRLLRVDDYNASGLIGPEYSDGQFAAVVRRQLDSFKQQASRAGGSYGLGKATLWATSRFGLVLINSTLSRPFEGRTARRVIGRLDLPWHTVDERAFAGPSWFGELDTEPDHEGIARSWWADEETVRDLHLDRPNDDPGTSFLVVGAHDASGAADTLAEMHDKLVRSLAKDFWAAMVSGGGRQPMLEASVTALRNGQTVIPEKRVDPHEHHPALSHALQAYLDGETVDVLTEGAQVAQARVPLTVVPRRTESRRKGTETEHEAVLLVTPADETDPQPNQVVLMRGNRMTVREYRPRELPLGAMTFQAVLLAGYATGGTGEEVELAEQFLRASEPPEHNRWGKTEELTATYARGALSRLTDFHRAIDEAVRRLVGRSQSKSDSGPAVLRELLRFDSPTAGLRRNQPVPTVRTVNATIGDDGAWNVSVSLKLPDIEDPWSLTPVAKFDVRSGSRPDVPWRLVSAENCRIEGGSLVIEPGVRTASFTAITDPSRHPVPSRLSRLVVDVQRTRGGAA
ncbi:helix-turn-helix transcriptional regulator [Amycolatopsis nalaikhensis]|uniref:Helix-turn-helix transcriptional regulator n=1 Tax=Amycolatopsis nalaikhensis TaxID=715472 RepID=A0ABY8XY11_9PSEU|nr:helix-turn-helix transcriptional regulator [Amycolatopsis sp. 2-2]WIV60604.1 helix-turn-helix transcriptional regulator [Amycolatopsis sp. 2-2]